MEYEYNSCRYCQKQHNAVIDKTKVNLSDNKTLVNHFRKFTYNRRKTGACKNCVEKLTVIQELKNLIQTKQKSLRQRVENIVEPEITVKLEEEDEEYKDPLIALEYDSDNKIDNKCEDQNLSRDGSVDYDSGSEPPLETNLKVEINESEIPYEACDICELNVPADQLKLHIETKHMYSRKENPISNSKLRAAPKKPIINEKLKKLSTDEIVKLAVKNCTVVKETKQKLLNCPICNKSVIGTTNLKRHLTLTKHEDKNKLAAERSRKKREEMKGSQSLTGRPPPVLFHKCQWCSKEFNRLSSLKLHTTNVHKIIPEPVQKDIRYICHFCNNGMLRRSSILKHIRSYHMGIKRKESFRFMFCDKCERDIKVRARIEFERHYYKCNGEVKEYIPQCCQCQKTFETDEQLRHHFDTTHGDFVGFQSKNKMRKHKCPYCLKRFFFRYGYEQHFKDNTYIENRHLLSVPKICEECGKGFSNSSTYRSHVRAHKTPLNTLPKTIKCEEPGCTKVFATKNLLKSHQRYHRGGKHKCELCSYIYHYTLQIQRHNKMYHKNGEPLTCTDCKETYQDFEAYSKHLTTHKPIACELCSNRFSRRNTYQRHLRDVHKTKETQS